MSREEAGSEIGGMRRELHAHLVGQRGNLQVFRDPADLDDRGLRIDHGAAALVEITAL